jgi:pimeloyl-ACP methyl ester carboxylesterase
LPLNFSRLVRKIYPNEKEIGITVGGGIKLYGTLLSKHPSQKLVVIIAGSGPTDRDGNNPGGDKADSYEMLAHSLDSQNIATFRFDKRGVAASIPADFNESSLVFDDYIDDVKTICNYLQDSLEFKNIYLAGHSEGSLIGMVAAQTTRLKGYISIAGAGRPIDQVIEQQVNAQAIPDSVKNEITRNFNELKKGKTVSSVPRSLNMLFRKSLQPYMMSWLKHDPTLEIKKLRCPVLILQGTCDKQVTVTDAENLHRASLNSKWDIIPRMTHTLKNADNSCHDVNNQTYMDPSMPINQQLVHDIVLFVGK